MATTTTKLGLSKPASTDLVSAFQGTVGTSFDTIDANIGINSVAGAVVATAQTTSSSSFTDLATAGPAVTVTVPASGNVKVTLTSDMQQTTQSDYAIVSFAISGATTAAAGTNGQLVWQCPLANFEICMSATFYLTGLTAGSTTFTAKYKIITGGTATFSGRHIIVETLP